LRPGTVADLAAFDVLEGEFEFFDVRKNRESGSQMIAPVLTVRAGKIYRPAELREELDETRRRVREMNALSAGNFAALGWTPGEA